MEVDGHSRFKRRSTLSRRISRFSNKSLNRRGYITAKPNRQWSIIEHFAGHSSNLVIWYPNRTALEFLTRYSRESRLLSADVGSGRTDRLDADEQFCLVCGGR